MTTNEPPFISCDVCGRPIGEHVIFHEEPDHLLTEAIFGGVDTSGFYCPPDLIEMTPAGGDA